MCTGTPNATLEQLVDYALLAHESAELIFTTSAAGQVSATVAGAGDFQKKSSSQTSKSCIVPIVLMEDSLHWRFCSRSRLSCIERSSSLFD